MLLVTGITGHSGRYFLEELINNKYEGPIRCIVRETSDTSLLNDSGLSIEKVVGDIDDKEFMNEVMTGVGTVIHIAGIQKTLNVIEVAIKRGVKRGILVHTTGIYSKFKSASEEYENIEIEVNKMINQEGAEIKVTILRPTMIYGDLCDLNMSKFITMVDKLRLFPVINHGSSLIQPVNARDLGKAYYQLLIMPSQHSKSEYVLSGEKPITMVDAFKLISDNLGKKTFFISFPLGFGVFLAKCIKVASIGRINYVEKVLRMGENRSFEHSDAVRDFLYNPISFEDGIRLEVEQYLTIIVQK